MTVALNGFEIVRAVGDNPSVFADARDQVQKAALAIFGAQLKCKSLNCPKVSAVRTALGPGAFSLLLEHLPDKSLASVTKKLDPHNKEQVGAAGDWHRKHIGALASGIVAPAEKPAPSPKKKKSAVSTKKPHGRRITEENFYPTSMSEAVGSRKKR